MSDDKGKQVVAGKMPATALMANPATGSGNPASSLPLLWAYVKPALDHIMRSPSNDTSKAPSIDATYHMGVHTHVYNYFTTQSSEPPYPYPRDREKRPPVSGTDLYEEVDKYYTEVAKELFLGAPHDDSTLIHYLIPCFNRYSAGAQSVNRLLNYVNRHYVKRAVDEDKGWLRLNEMFVDVAKDIREDDTREKISQKLRDKKLDELKKWGWEENGSKELLARAEASAEAASAPDRVVPLSSLAYRRFRIAVIDPLLAVPKGKHKGKVKKPSAGGDRLPQGPKGRLARAVKELLESQGVNEEERETLIRDMAACLRLVGIKVDHPLRRKLDRFVAALDSE
ncbi:hypothetical protein JAAARDRAFT_160229 [Jaapia argillacea MUCL 33604]|uniref:Uncharacterized protein n=1 Tax=Jaapia argillacea MUCL 33604 TaxID=933084 RepID=A0A067PM90_9AGAM|nr:hypothetical protein JAAARDRAFT_160229 [Jaapia argillacea MUCL 33604]